MELHNLTGYKLHNMLQTKKISAVELIKAVFTRVEKVERKVKAYLNLDRDLALSRAKKIDQNIKSEKKISFLTGLPIAVKDNICTKGIITTCASRMLENFNPVYNATVAQRIIDRGAVIAGKTNMDEFAMGSSTENSAFGPTFNPWNLETVPGGSSGGSAAAVAAGEAIFSLGSDTGGSIRQPASLCGVVGLKPTYGLISRYGLIAFASSLDQIGPITKDVRDCACLLNEIAGHDPKDSTSLRTNVPDYTKALVQEIGGLRIGIPKELMGEGVSRDVKDSVEKALELLRGLGAHVEETSLPHLDYALSAYYLIAPAEASSNLARYDGVRYGYRAEDVSDILEMYSKTRALGFGDEVKRRIMLGTYALSAGYYEAYYGQAQKVRTLVVRDFNEAFEKFDVLISPTSPTPAFKIGEKVADPLQMYLSDICTIPVNLAGIPAISIPCGAVNGLPVGLQIMGKVLGEETVLRVAYAFEQNFAGMGKPPLRI